MSNVPALVKAINEGSSTEHSARDQYIDLMNQYPRGNEDQEYPIEVIWGIGVISGCDLPVALECESSHHNHTGSKYKVLPYAFKDGTANLLLCYDCSIKERSDILDDHPEWEVD